MSSIHGCSSIRQGVALREGSFSRLKIVRSENEIQETGGVYSPAFDEILKVVGPVNAILRLVLQLRDRLTHDVREQVDEAGARLHLRSVGREWESMLGHFQQRDAQRPHIRRDGVRLARDPFRSHVVRRADERVGIAFRAELAADPEVAELNLAVSTEQDVRWLDIYTCRSVITCHPILKICLPRWMIFRLWR